MANAIFLFDKIYILLWNCYGADAINVAFYDIKERVNLQKSQELLFLK